MMWLKLQTNQRTAKQNTCLKKILKIKVVEWTRARLYTSNEITQRVQLIAVDRK